MTFQLTYAVERGVKEEKSETITGDVSKKISSDTNNTNSKENPIVVEKNKRITPPKRSSDSDGFKFDPIDSDKVIDKTNETGDKLWLFTQAFSWPLFVVTIGGGIVLLFLGGLFGSKKLKGMAGFLFFLAILKVVIVNFAPEIAQTIITWIQDLNH